jgi:heme-degrading monooxygenase HmoA
LSTVSSYRWMAASALLAGYKVSIRQNLAGQPPRRRAAGYSSGAVALMDRESGKIYSITFWESEADLKNFVESDTQAKLQAKMREAGGPQMSWENLEVIVDA